MRKRAIYSPFVLILDVGLLVFWIVLQVYLGYSWKEAIFSGSTWLLFLAVLAYVSSFIRYHKRK